MHTYESRIESMAKFLRDIAGIKVSVPKIIISKKIRDIEEYRFEGNKSYIVINLLFFKKYKQKTGQEIDLDALLAHSFFHHVQRVLGIDYAKIARKMLSKIYISDQLGNKLVDEASKNILESSAMLFALAYLTKGRNRKAKIIKKLRQKAYLPLRGRHFNGNELIIEYLKHHSINQTIREMLSAKRSNRNRAKQRRI